MLKLSIIHADNPAKPKHLEINAQNLLQGECTIGRLSSCQITLDHPKVSRHHAKIVFQPEGYFLVDEGSRGSTSLNQSVITPNQPYPLKTGDIIVICDFTLEIRELQLAADDVTTIGIGTALPTVIDPVKTLTPADYMPVALVNPGEMPRWSKGELMVRCNRIIDETEDVKTFCFVAESPTLFTYKPGQFVTLDLDINGEHVLRSYSISSTPSRPHTLEITVKRVPPPPDAGQSPPGKVSNWLHDHLQVGQRVKLSGPLGKFTCFAQPAPKLLFISAGSGITPMMSMTRWLFDTAAGCDVIFFHSARSPQDIIFRQELEILACRMPELKLALTVSRRKAGQGWSGLIGRLTPEMLQLIAPDFRERHVYVCGPGTFMEGVKDMLTQLEFPMTQYFEESFGSPKKAKKSPSLAPLDQGMSPPEPLAPTAKRPVFGLASVLEELQLQGGQATPVATPIQNSPVPVKASPATRPVVKFAKSGKEVPCDEDLSILELAEQEGVKIRSSCRVGSCGTCKKQKLEGTVQMEGFDPESLEPSEIAAGFILTCVAFPRGRVVVDA